jgi:hypothetical protein
LVAAGLIFGGSAGFVSFGILFFIGSFFCSAVCAFSFANLSSLAFL